MQYTRDPFCDKTLGQRSGKYQSDLRTARMSCTPLGALAPARRIVARSGWPVPFLSMRRAGVAWRSWRGAGALLLLVASGLIQLHGAADAASSPTVLYAAPLGQGTACTEAMPCSLLGAQAVARQDAVGMTSDLDVELGGGTYDLARPWSFGPQDSGTNGHEVTYEAGPGQHPVISGAYPIAGWHLVDAARGIWAAPVAPGFDTGQLYVNGQSVPRSIGLPSAFYLQTSTGFISSAPVLAGWRDVTSVSAVFNGGNGAWTQTSCPVAAVHGDVITMVQPCWGNLHLPGDGSQEVSWVYGPQGGFGGLSGAAQPSDFENAPELLTPGHWSIDTSAHQLYYDPPAGQSMATATVLAPVLGSLLDVDGSLSTPVHDLAFAGLQFSYATWTQPDTTQGFAEMQADWTLTGPNAANSQGTCSYSLPPGTCPYASWTRTPGAVQLSGTHHVTLAFDTFSHLGGVGLDIEYGSQDDLVQGNEFTDIAASAVQLGSTDDPLPTDLGAGSNEVDADDTITDNDIHNVANQYLGGVGIWVGYAHHAVISHNQIDHVPYTAISIGWAGWHSNVLSPNSDPNVNAYNVVSDNLLYDYMQSLGDGGAIYTNGGQAPNYAEQLLVSGNVAYGGTNTDFSLYTDTGSQYIELSHNIVYDQPVDSFASGGCHTVGHIHLDGNYFSQAGPLYPCDLAVDVVPVDTTLVCTTLAPGEVPGLVLAQAGLEPGFDGLLEQAPPSLNLIGPAALPLAGGRVLLSGSGFTPDTHVHFGASPAANVSVLSANYLLATAPPGSGNVGVTVTTAAGTSALGPGTTLEYSATPGPCLPLVGSGFSTGLGY